MRWKFAPAALLPLLTLACSGAEGPTDTQETGTAQTQIVSAPNERVEVFVILDRAPVADTWRRGAGPAAAQRHRAEVRKDHAAMRKELAKHGAIVMEELELLANAFHVEVKRGAIERLKALPGVEAIEPAPMFHATLGQGLPSVRAPQAWTAPLGLHGAGIKVGIIDTGVDYYHAAFGGTGDPADFSGDDSAVLEPGTFPTGRVVGGFDFVGDNYNPEIGASTIAADPDPLDCEGHGTHVASIATGNAVNDDGSIFTGTYDQSLNLNQFRVAPGVAPEADIYALKVFGCARGTSVVASALEWAADPDGDGNPDDRLDVVNLSLGSSYDIAGTLFYGEVMDNLVGVGTVVVAAAGNDGGTFFVTGSPGSVPPVLSVAASVNSGLVNVETSAGDLTGVEGAIALPLSSSGTIDAAAEALSVGVRAPGDMMMMYGSTIFIIMPTPGRLVDPRLWHAPWLAPGSHAAMAGLATSGTLTHWFRDRFAADLPRETAFAALAAEAETSPPGARGLIALPYFSGERTPLHDPDVRGTFLGLDLTHSRGDLYRALIEGIAFGTRHVMETYAEAGARPARLMAVGGGTKNRLWLQATSDITGLDQVVSEVSLGAAYGDAFLAARAIGAAGPEDIARWNPARETITAHPDPVYERRYGQFRRLYGQTREIMAELAKESAGAD